MDVLTLDDGDFGGRTVLVRVDFNVPLDEGKVVDDARIRAALPTIEHLRKAGAKVVLMSHLGRPKGEVRPESSLRPVADHLRRALGVPCAFVDECVGPAVHDAVERLDAGDVLLLENLRFHKQETDNDDAFAAELAALAECYINDAFGTAHRAHASTTGVAAHLPSHAGRLMEKEIRILGDILRDPARPFTAILGGAKVSDKIGVIENLLGIADRLIIGGGMAFTFLKAQGFEVGTSMVEDDKLELAGQLLGGAQERKVQVLLPEDVEAADAFEQKAMHRAVKMSHMRPDWMGLDIGPLTMKRFAAAIGDSGTVVWNGPMGVFEWKPFSFGTRSVAQAVARCEGTTVVGGGDTAAAAKQFGIVDRLTHVSTGGGASLELMEGKVLPGIQALQAAAQRAQATV